MRSIRTKTILLSLIGITISTAVATTIGAINIANQGHASAEQALNLLCESGKNKLNYYFKSVEQSVNTVAGVIDSELDSISDDDYKNNFSEHVEKSKKMFSEAVQNTNGVYTYYYRFDPSVTSITKQEGYWFTKPDGQTFKEHEVTDLSDSSKECRWFYMTKAKDGPLWLNPYITDNLDECVVSYNTVVKRNGEFVGVVGIEIHYTTLGKEIEDIKLQKTGYAFVVDSETGSLIYHRNVDLAKTAEKDRPVIPEDLLNGMKNNEEHIVYTYEGIEKHCSFRKLSNGMNIVVAVPLSEINESWQNLILQIVLIGASLVVIFVVISILYSRRITKPLAELTKAAEEIDNGNYDVKLDYKDNDEIGVLTSTVNNLIKHLGEYINDLNTLAYADALTAVRNKGAFNVVVDELQKLIDDPNENPEFAIAILDCDNLKDINDAYGHDKGDVYLKNSCHLMCRIFEKSVVYRLGGDEFAVILQNEDYKNRKELEKYFIRKSKEICSFAKEPWEQIRVSIGIAEYDPSIDKTVKEVMVHADHLMYTNKRSRKAENKKGNK